MTKVIFGNHSAVWVSRAEKDRIREFYRDVLGGQDHEGGRSERRLLPGRQLLFTFLYENEGVALDESGFSKAIYLELKADNVEEVGRRLSPSASRSLRCRIRTSTFKPREDRSCGWSGSTRTSPNMRGPSTANSSWAGRSNENAIDL